MENFSGKCAVVTGAGAGIGREIALHLAAKGADLALVDIQEGGISQLAEALRAQGRRVVTVCANVAAAQEVAAAIAKINAGLGPVDILINNAGILRTAPFLEIAPEDWRKLFAVNLDGVFHMSRAVLPTMVARSAGVILNISSWTGKKGVPNHAAYGATKAAIINLTQSLAAEFGPQGIRVNAICPGIIVDTDMRTVAEEMNQAQGLPDVSARVRAIPLGRAGRPQDIAELVAFLASERAAYMTGQAINVTGGHWMN